MLIFRRRWYFFVAVTLLSLGGYYWFVFKPGQNAGKPAYTVRRQNLQETLSVSGQIDSEEKAALKFQTTGYLSWLGVKEGDPVKKYQTIASLDQESVKKNLQKDLNDYLSNRWDFEQGKDNYSGQAVTPAIQRILDKNQFSLNNTVLDVEIQNLAVQYSNLWSPIDGIVTHLDAPNAGVNVTATTEFDVVNPRKIYFSASVDQDDVVKLTASQSGEIILDAYPDKTIPSDITAISFTPKAGETGTVYEVKMSLPVDNSDYSYRLGMTGDANFIIRKAPNVIAVPTKYIQSNDDGSKYVWIIKNGKKTRQNIETGDTFDTDTEIKSGLAVGTQVTN